MLSGAVALMNGTGTVLTTYQAYGQEVSQRDVILMCAVGGVALSILLQAVSGRFSREKPPLATRFYQVLVRDYITHYFFGVVVPLSVFYCYIKLSADTIANKTFQLVQIEKQIILKGRDVTSYYPVLVGVNMGFLIGQTVGRVAAWIIKG